MRRPSCSATASFAARPPANARSTSPGVPPILPRRIVAYEGRPAFLLAAEDETGHGRPILLTQQDLRELQLAAGAIRAGIALLLRRAGWSRKTWTASWWAAASAISSAATTPNGSACCPAGSSETAFAIRGTRRWPGRHWRLCLSDRGSLADELARRIEHVDLSCDAEFHAAFAEAMIFPEQ